jgi:cholesterol transport system auxiliary component
MKKPRPWPLPPRPLITLITLMTWLFLIFLLSGCGKPPNAVENYILEYSSPAMGARPQVDQNLTVEQFAVAQAYNSTDMVYRPSPYESDVYRYHRWRVNPGYLVTDYLIRDLRNSRLFRGVFLGPNLGNSRYQLEGTVEEFQELDEPAGWQATLAINITLLDTAQELVPQRVVFQRNYRAAAPLPQKTPQGLAQGMSQSMETLSAQIIHDVYQACQKRPAARKE